MKSHANLGICAWNVNGLKHGKIERIRSDSSKLIQDIFLNNDIICFTETWRDKSDCDFMQLHDNFSEFQQLGARNSKRGRSSGGISVLIRKTVDKYLSILSASPYRVWCKLDKECCNSAEDLIICFAYIPPSDSTWFKSGLSLNFDVLREECAEYEKLGNCVILGDLNARTSDHLDFICNDETDDFLPLDNNHVPDDTLDKPVMVGLTKEIQEILCVLIQREAA